MMHTAAFPDQALCAEKGPDDALWFPHQHKASQAVRVAKRVCHQCPVMEECLETALQMGPACAGIWGGMTERQRRKLRTKRRRLAQIAEKYGHQLEELGA